MPEIRNAVGPEARRIIIIVIISSSNSSWFFMSIDQVGGRERPRGFSFGSLSSFFRCVLGFTALIDRPCFWAGWPPLIRD